MFASAQTSPLPEKRCYCTTHETNCVWISYTQLECTNLTKLRVLAVTEIGHARCDIIAKTSKRIYTEIKNCSSIAIREKTTHIIILIIEYEQKT